MPSKTDTTKGVPTQKDFDDLDNYFDDLDDDPFASPKPAEKSKESSNKRKEPGDGLGIDEEIAVAKKARVPRIKLDEERLLSDKGIPELRKRAGKLHLKGKGHEFGDAARLLSFYQHWLDDLFPKAKFLDAVAMVEKAGHKKSMHLKRMEWINEGKPKSKSTEDDPFETIEPTEESAPKEPTKIAPIFEQAASSRPKTPEADDLFGDEDIYNATPLATRKDSQPAGDAPDDDDLDALMAEAEADRGSSIPKAIRAPVKSIFGDGKPTTTARPAADDPDDDDLDALLAEAEAEQSSKPNSRIVPKILAPAAADDNDDDLDALMAEAEAQPAPPKDPAAENPGKVSPKPNTFSEEEEAMAEMEGMW